jgi:hypothetical protein
MPKYVQEFNGRLRGKIGPLAGTFVEYRSPAMSTMYASPGKPAGSDRDACPNVNGFVNLKVVNKAIYSVQTIITATLWGESFGAEGAIPLGVRSGRCFSVIRATNIDKVYRSGDIINFDLLSTSGNLHNNVYIKVTVQQDDTDSFGNPTPVDIIIAGALLAYG